jgi:hypothetical protein
MYVYIAEEEEEEEEELPSELPLTFSEPPRQMQNPESTCN